MTVWHMQMTVRFSICLLLMTFAVSVRAQENLIENGGFERWSKGIPSGWQVTPGIFNGQTKPESKIKQGDGPCLEIYGNVRTYAWNIVSQNVPMKPGETYRLKFKAKVKGLKREINQHDNCHIGFWYKNAQGQTVGNEIAWVKSGDFEDYVVTANVPGGVTSADVSIVLSKTGRLYVKDVALAADRGLSSFDTLMEAMKAKYSYFEHKNIDPDQLANKYRAQANDAASKDDFIKVILPMLAELKDNHCWIRENGKMLSEFGSGFTPNYDFNYVNQKLKFKKAIGQFALAGTTHDGLGYLRIVSLIGITKAEVKELQQTIVQMMKTKGMIIDLRRNKGGDEPTAQQVAGMFADKDYLYAKQKFRSGEGFGPVSDRVLRPVTKGKCYDKPIICLVGPGAISSAEGMALMMKSIDHCRLVGLPTRGSSGNPAPVTLPNGVEVWFSRWVAMNADGIPIEGRGVLPEIEIPHDPGKANADPAFDKAVELLSK